MNRILVIKLNRLLTCGLCQKFQELQKNTWKNSILSKINIKNKNWKIK